MTERFVDPNTDNLDDFSALFHGEAKELEEVKDATPESAEDEDGSVTPEGETDAEDDALVETDDDATDEAEDDGDTDAPEPPAKKKSRFQERIDELTNRAKEAEARERETARKVEEILAREKAKETAAKPEPKADVEGPTPDDLKEDGSEKYPLGEFDPAYIRDLTRFTISQETERAKAEAAQEAEQRKVQEAQAQLATEWSGKLESATERYPDLLEKNAALESTFRDIEPQYGEYLATTIMSMDYGPDVLYYLGNNVEEAKRIAASGPLKATIALGRLEAKFADAAAEKQLQKPKVSKAPVPAPVNKGTAVNKTVAPDTDDLDAFSAMFFAKK